MDITLQSQSVMDERTGEVTAPSEWAENLKHLERSIQEYDDAIDALKTSLKEAKEARERAVAQLRTAIRDGKVLPLLEAEDETESDGEDRAN